MVVEDKSFLLPQENIDYDELLLSKAEKGEGSEVLRFWESPDYFVVLGRIGKEEEDVYPEAVTKDHVPILRRFSGGGTVLQGKGCLNYSLILSKDLPEINDLRRSYQFILEKIVKALGTLNVACEF